MGMTYLHSLADYFTRKTVNKQAKCLCLNHTHEDAAAKAWSLGLFIVQYTVLNVAEVRHTVNLNTKVLSHGISQTCTRVCQASSCKAFMQ